MEQLLALKKNYLELVFLNLENTMGKYNLINKATNLFREVKYCNVLPLILMQ